MDAKRRHWHHPDRAAWPSTLCAKCCASRHAATHRPWRLARSAGRRGWWFVSAGGPSGDPKQSKLLVQRGGQLKVNLLRGQGDGSGHGGFVEASCVCGVARPDGARRRVAVLCSEAARRRARRPPAHWWSARGCRAPRGHRAARVGRRARVVCAHVVRVRAWGMCAPSGSRPTPSDVMRRRPGRFLRPVFACGCTACIDVFLFDRFRINTFVRTPPLTTNDNRSLITTRLAHGNKCCTVHYIRAHERRH